MRVLIHSEKNETTSLSTEEEHLTGLRNAIFYQSTFSPKEHRWVFVVHKGILSNDQLESYQHNPHIGIFMHLRAGPSPVEGSVVPGPPIWNLCLPISRLTPWLLHTSNRVFLKCSPPLLVFGPSFWFLASPAAIAWRTACLRVWIFSIVRESYPMILSALWGNLIQWFSALWRNLIQWSYPIASMDFQHNLK